MSNTQAKGERCVEQRDAPSQALSTTTSVSPHLGRHVDVPWYRFAVAGVCITVGFAVGWMLITKQWPVLDRSSFAHDGPPDPMLSLLSAISYYSIPFMGGAAVKVATDNDAAGTVAGAVLLFLTIANILGPALGCVLIAVGLLGAIAALVGGRDEAADHDGARHQTSTQPPSEREMDETWLGNLAQLIEEASPDLTVTMREHLAAIRGAAQEALPRLRREGLATPELLATRAVVARHAPDTLRNYLALPNDFRRATLADGRTVQASTEAQLARIRQELDEALKTSLQTELRAVAVQDAFLRARFPTDGVLTEGSRT